MIKKSKDWNKIAMQGLTILLIIIIILFIWRTIAVYLIEKDINSKLDILINSYCIK